MAVPDASTRNTRLASTTRVRRFPSSRQISPQIRALPDEGNSAIRYTERTRPPATRTGELRAARDGTNSYREYVTFPTDPLYYEAPAAAGARAQSPETINVESGVNTDGQSFGSGEGVESDADLPDLVAAIGTNGEVGYIEKTALHGPAATPSEAVASDPGARTVPLYDKDATTVIGEFAIS